MQEDQLEAWIKNFERALESIQIEFDAFFQKRKIQDYCRIRINKNSGNFSIDINRKNELPVEIIDRITAAYLGAKPK